MKLRVGVAGMRRGTSFARMFVNRDDCEVVAVCDLNAARAEQAAAGIGATAYSEYGAFCEHDMDAVAIITPPPTHAECSVAAMECGKHVLCEVPAVCTLEEAERVARTVARTGLKYMFAENMNYFGFVRTMEDLVKRGRLGKVFYAEGEYIHDCRGLLFDRDDGLGGGVGERPSWRAELPPIHYCTHDLGPILMMMEDRVVAASGMSVGSNVAPELGTVADMEVGIFRTEKGAVIKMLCGFCLEREPAHHFISLYGTGGSIETDRYNPYTNLKAYFKDVLHLQGLMDIPTSINQPKAPPQATAGGHGTSEYFMIEDFVRCILDDTEPAIDVYEGLDYTVPGICAHLSATRGGELVEVPDFRARSRG